VKTKTPLTQEMAIPKQKRLLLVLSCFVLMLLAWVGILAFRPFGPRHRINRAGVGDLRKGITEGEVVQILGIPAGDYSSRRRRYVDEPITSLFIPADPTEWKEWVGDEVKVRIGFDPNGKVCLINRSWALPEQDILTRIRHWLGLN
jgi:hypothetical protein